MTVFGVDCAERAEKHRVSMAQGAEKKGAGGCSSQSGR